jgi:hypothetical protein
VIIRAGPGANDAGISCFSDYILIDTPQLNIALPSSGADKVLTCLDGDGAAEWRDLPPAAIQSRIQDLNGAVVECVTGDVAITTLATGQVKIGASGVATSKITLESAALQVSIPSVGADKVLTSIDGVGTAEWRPIPAIQTADQIQNFNQSVDVVCGPTELFMTAGQAGVGFALTCTGVVGARGSARWLPVLGLGPTFGGLANQATLRNTLQINGNMGTTISNVITGPGAIYIAPEVMTLTAVQYDCVSSNTTTVWSIYKNGALIATFSPSAASPQRGNKSLALALGVGLFFVGESASVKWTAGTQPNGSLVTLYFRSGT